MRVSNGDQTVIKTPILSDGHSRSGRMEDRNNPDEYDDMLISPVSQSTGWYHDY